MADFGDGSAADLLVILGQLAAQRHFAIRSEHVKQVGHGFVDAVQGFVEDDGATFRFERAQVLHTFAVLARQEAFVAEAVGRQAGQAQRVEHGGRAGSAGDGQAAFDGAADDRQSRIVDGGHARVGYDEHGGALFDLVEQAVGLVAFVVVVVGDDAAGHADAEAVRERV